VFTREKLDEIGARLEYTSQKSSVAIAIKLLKLQPHKVTVVHALQPCDLASRIHFYNLFFQSVHDGEDDPRSLPKY
jgi:hypothetical protein